MSSLNLSTHTIREFEGLRGWLAMVVILGHWGTTLPQSLAPLPQYLWATDAVDVFIMLSGFVITALLSRGGEHYWRYILRRWFRLWPAFVVALALGSLLLSFTEHVLRETLPAMMREERLRMVVDAQQHFWLHLVAHLTLLHGLAPEALSRFMPYAIVGQGWSISLEWQFYLLAPLFYACLTRRGWGYTFAMAILVVGLVLSGQAFSQAYLGNKLGFFALGYLSYRLWQWYLAHPQRYSLLHSRMIAGGAILVSFAFKYYWGLGVTVWLWVFASVLLAQRGDARVEKRIAFVWLSPVSQFLGRISYSLYLIHFQMLVVALWVLSPTALATWGGSLRFLLLTLALSILSAFLMHRLVERPGMRLGKMLAGS